MTRCCLALVSAALMACGSSTPSNAGSGGSGNINSAGAGIVNREQHGGCGREYCWHGRLRWCGRLRRCGRRRNEGGSGGVAGLGGAAETGGAAGASASSGTAGLGGAGATGLSGAAGTSANGGLGSIGGTGGTGGVAGSGGSSGASGAGGLGGSAGAGGAAGAGGGCLRLQAIPRQRSMSQLRSCLAPELPRMTTSPVVLRRAHRRTSWTSSSTPDQGRLRKRAAISPPARTLSAASKPNISRAVYASSCSRRRRAIRQGRSPRRRGSTWRPLGLCSLRPLEVGRRQRLAVR